MSKKPSYLGTLNAIALGAARGQKILSAWQCSTNNVQLAQVLEFLAIREQEHAAAFSKRISELGYSLQDRPSGRFDEHLEQARGTADDRQKFINILGYAETQKTADPLLRIFADTSIDATTGELLGRYIAEDRDSNRRLRAEFDRLEPQAKETDSDSALHDIATRLDRLTSTLDELKSLRR